MVDAVAPTKTIAVACRGLTKEFDSGEAKVRAVVDVDVDVYAGELTLLVGPSGCGKTTLISLIAGLLEPTLGHITLFDVDQSTLSKRQRVRYRAANIGFVFQQYNLLPSLSATDNVAVPLLIGRQPRDTARQRAAQILDAVDLAPRAHALPGQLSGGQQQRVAIARALVHQPRLLVCDEPTAALDAHSGQTVMELLRRVALQDDRAVIVVTHDSRVFGFGDRIIEMADGRVTTVTATPHSPPVERA